MVFLERWYFNPKIVNLVKYNKKLEVEVRRALK